MAETYDRVRLPYFQPLLDRAQSMLGLSPQARVLDLGAGTGRLTRELERRFETVVAVEPDDAMRALIDARGTVLAGSAEAIPLGPASVDAVFVGEAFHWFDLGRALPEIARVVAPRGGLALVEMHWWETEPPLPAAALELLREPYERFGGAVQTNWRAFESTPFEPLREEEFADELTVDADWLQAMYSTLSTVALLPEAERATLLAALRPLLAGPYRIPVKPCLVWTLLGS